ncbi:hypothetical protein P7K49_011401 [Saguinus oedipus]|uniref:Uncharacterized protein n=1 Tax=Saguinus oedipus TaxID=9490 RepID=A0ABQ9VR56_SAGOE|nr:hypothetical protein P7K49_011401 [Saguinus oedipus]
MATTGPEFMYFTSPGKNGRSFRWTRVGKRRSLAPGVYSTPCCPLRRVGRWRPAGRKPNAECESRSPRFTFPRASVPTASEKGRRAQAAGKRILVGAKWTRKGNSDQLLPGEKNTEPAAAGEGATGASYPEELHGHKAEPLLLEALNDLAHQAALHAVRLDGDEGTLEVGHGPAGREVQSGPGLVRSRGRRPRGRHRARLPHRARPQGHVASQALPPRSGPASLCGARRPAGLTRQGNLPLRPWAGPAGNRGPPTDPRPRKRIRKPEESPGDAPPSLTGKLAGPGGGAAVPEQRAGATTTPVAGGGGGARGGARGGHTPKGRAAQPAGTPHPPGRMRPYNAVPTPSRGAPSPGRDRDRFRDRK